MWTCCGGGRGGARGQVLTWWLGDPQYKHKLLSLRRCLSESARGPRGRERYGWVKSSSIGEVPSTAGATGGAVVLAAVVGREALKYAWVAWG